MIENVKYFICPMSKNIVDAIIELNSEKIGLLPTRRQIDFNGGYVNNWNTKKFNNYVRSKSNTIIERDHSGANQGAYEDDGYESYKNDAKYLNIIHIDPWIKYPDLIEGTVETYHNIVCINNLNSNVCFEIGTEEKIRPFSERELLYLLTYLKRKLSDEIFNKILYVVVQSGVALDLLNKKNMGIFNDKKLYNSIEIIKNFGKLSKEHNGDYLNDFELNYRFKKGISAINIGPELAQIETEYYLQLMSEEEINKYYQICLSGKKWEKWINYDISLIDKKKLISVCGHYHYDQLNIKYDPIEIKNIIKNKLINLISIC